MALILFTDWKQLQQAIRKQLLLATVKQTVETEPYTVKCRKCDVFKEKTGALDAQIRVGGRAFMIEVVIVIFLIAC